MNSTEALILFIGAVVVASLTVFALSAQFQSATSKANVVSTNAARSVSTAFQILSVYGNATDTNVVVKGILGTTDVNDLVVFVDGKPYRPSSFVFVRDSGNDGYLDAGDVCVLTIPAPVDTDKNCIKVVSPDTVDIYGHCV
ncbi:MAG: hypothetical protein GXN93_01140 [Candidatus Diapherotrites archaeon]|nr:hypothetical protein [Candidatus Diapherotrites archaeon]